MARRTCGYWRIKFWDNHDSEGAWSTTTSSFSTAVPGTSGVIQNILFSYDNVGDITQINDYSGTHAAKTVLFGYDGLNRLISASSSTPYSQTYAYNAIGGLTSKSDQGSYSSSPLDQFTSATSSSATPRDTLIPMSEPCNSGGALHFQVSGLSDFHNCIVCPEGFFVLETNRSNPLQAFLFDGHQSGEGGICTGMQRSASNTSSAIVSACMSRHRNVLDPLL